MSARHIGPFAALVAGILGALTNEGRAGPPVVHFDQDLYIVSGPGNVITAGILIDFDADTPRDDLVPLGLFSFGVAASFNSTKAQVGGVADISPAPELDFFGFAPGAFEQAQPGFAGVKGNVNTLGNVVPYASSLLAQITLTNLASAVDSYPLDLDFFRTVGPNEQMFLDGGGNVLDPTITFRPARVLVIPEPSTALLLVAGFVCCLMCCLRSLRFSRRPTRR